MSKRNGLRIMRAIAVFFALWAPITIVGLGGGTAQEVATKWVLGVWEGAFTGSWIRDDVTRFEFAEQGGVIKWKMVRKGTITGRRPGDYISTQFEASGVVTKISESSVVLEGKYDWASASELMGRRVGYSLNRSGDSLEADGLGGLTGNLPFHISVKKVK